MFLREKVGAFRSTPTVPGDDNWLTGRQPHQIILPETTIFSQLRETPMPDEPTRPTDSSLADELSNEMASQPADDRVYHVAVQLHEPTRVATIAERADCAVDTARRHLRKLVDIGVLEQTGESPDTFARNESYFEWRKLNRLAQLSQAERRDRLRELSEQAASFRQRFDAEDPSGVDALEHADHADVEAVWRDLDDWQTIRERIERLEAVRQRQSGNPGVA